MYKVDYIRLDPAVAVAFRQQWIRMGGHDCYNFRFEASVSLVELFRSLAGPLRAFL